MDFAAPSFSELAHTFLRFAHVLFGIAWIGMLYFFNLVNVPVMAKLDGPTKGKLIPVLMPKALWLFRWGAVWTWLAGFVYYVMFVSSFNVSHAYLAVWLVVTLVFYAGIYFVLDPKAKLQQKTSALAAILVLVCIVYFIVVRLLNEKFTPGGEPNSHVLYIGYGGGLGTFMLLNVWGIIWRNQKKIIAWTAANAESGTPVPPESPVLARQAFLASRTNAWMSIPMLLLMIMAGHFSRVLVT